MNEYWRSNLRRMAEQSDSALDAFYLRLAAMPKPWTLVSTIAIAVVLIGIGSALA